MGDGCRDTRVYGDVACWLGRGWGGCLVLGTNRRRRPSSAACKDLCILHIAYWRRYISAAGVAHFKGLSSQTLQVRLSDLPGVVWQSEGFHPSRQAIFSRCKIGGWLYGLPRKPSKSAFRRRMAHGVIQPAAWTGQALLARSQELSAILSHADVVRREWSMWVYGLLGRQSGQRTRCRHRCRCGQRCKGCRGCAHTMQGSQGTWPVSGRSQATAPRY